MSASPALPTRPCAGCGRGVPVSILETGGACPWCAGYSRKVPGADLVLKGHPKAVAETVGDTAVLSIRSGGGLFAWIWLGVSLVCTLIFAAVWVSGGEMRVNGRVIQNPGPLHYAAFFAIPTLFAMAGVLMLFVRRRVTLTAAFVESRMRMLPGFGWTSRLAVRGPVTAFLAPRGAKVNGRPVDAVVISSGGAEISFGSFMPEDLKAYVGAVINDYYGAASAGPAPFIEEPGR
jgi:hypothetical protein